MALRRSDRDLPALTVLALLLGGPRHTYEMHRLMVDTHKDFVTGLPRSMYHAVDRLLRDELIRVVGTDREGGRPERTVYALTDAGRAELGERVRRLLAHPEPDATLFVAALSFLGCLPVAEARAALDARRSALAHRADATRAGIAEVTGLPRLLLVEAEYEIARLTAEHDWVVALLADLDTGRLTWLTEELWDLEGPPMT
ncbi:PadR family transcriptional regulator [Pseudonocardia kunmingensis]|uniref:DNA-binding PadR family transcriptional regulator n=1 Tax=Pseudonocardia kunmingensis TaxID=630975 RepID=A0A543DK83_9PSEU|nr:PadR family transcriptional regulator [Pseudonocardia kunmingensis]TQM09740.1 DNA-binding PadR family transcriptional regulator [Pseudonocardia kunmingensis]